MGVVLTWLLGVVLGGVMIAAGLFAVMVVHTLITFASWSFHRTSPPNPVTARRENRTRWMASDRLHTTDVLSE